MDELSYKRKFKPSSCSSPPWATLIPAQDRPEILRIIRQECIDLYGHDFDECNKRFTCLKKTCIGRMLPWRSPTALPYLEKLKETQTITDGEMFIQTDCSACPIVVNCKNPCNQILDFIDRNKTEEPYIEYKETTENLDAVRESLEPSNFRVAGTDIPWDVLPERKQEVIKKYLYENRDFRYVGESLGINNQARARYEFYAAITKLSEYGIVRAFLADNIYKLTSRQTQIFKLVYLENKSFVEAAKILGISKQSVQQTVSRAIKKHKIKWKIYVKKKGTKVIYNVPQIFK